MKTLKALALPICCSLALFLTACQLFEGEESSENGTDSSLFSDEFSNGGSSQDLASGISGGNSQLTARPGHDWQPISGMELPTIYFAFDQSNIGTSQIPKLEAAAKYLKDNSSVGLIIEGHCDERGSAQYNLGLGERRSLAVRDYLEKLGVPADHMQTLSYGSEKPSDPGHDESAWLQNRRAELIPAKMN